MKSKLRSTNAVSLAQLTLASVFAYACGGPYDSRLDAGRVEGVPNGAPVMKSQEHYEIRGSWRSECVDGTQFELRAFRDRTLWMMTWFKDVNCIKPKFQEVIQWNEIIRRDQSGADGFRRYQFAPQKRYLDRMLVLLDAGDVRDRNQTRSCGVRDWTLQKAQSIVNTACDQNLDWSRMEITPSQEVDSGEIVAWNLDLVEGKSSRKIEVFSREETNTAIDGRRPSRPGRKIKI
jgi:hypothetical protein